ncbi:hypothetical protein ATCR1_03719 [Agrobacterium tumefaciens CCNWGS0286]|nr:hypothetical protein ATCR1_03719 [Agrobacterium tumefaciens CCNWGS0286]EPR12899.1 hypothetical protein L902_14740 [Agrobacterium radiobacter DSM 30147]
MHVALLLMRRGHDARRFLIYLRKKMRYVFHP